MLEEGFRRLIEVLDLIIFNKEFAYISTNTHDISAHRLNKRQIYQVYSLSKILSIFRTSFLLKMTVWMYLDREHGGRFELNKS